MILRGLFISIVVIFFILLFHFRRINMALLVLGSISLCLLGAALGIWVMGLDVSVTAVLGIVSLMGILVRNGIIMLDYADELREKEGLTVRKPLCTQRSVECALFFLLLLLHRWELFL